MTVSQYLRGLHFAWSNMKLPINKIVRIVVKDTATYWSDVINDNYFFFETRGNQLWLSFVLCTTLFVPACVTGFFVSFPPILWAVMIATQGSSTSAAATLVLYNWLNQHPRCLAGGSYDWPKITTSMGMALKEELDRFMTKCIEHQQNVAQTNEEVYINQLYHSANPRSPIGLALTTRVTDETIRDDTPLNHFMRKAKAYRVEWHAKRPNNQDPYFDYIQKRIDELDVEFVGDEQTAHAIQFWQAQIDNKEVNRTAWVDVDFAQTTLAALKDTVDQDRNKFYTSPTVEQLAYLEEIPKYAKVAKQIVTAAEQIVYNNKSKTKFADRTKKLPSEDHGSHYRLSCGCVETASSLQRRDPR